VKILLDTNVVLDFILERPDFIAEAEEIFVRLQNLEFEGFVSPITPVNAFYTTKKEVDSEAAFSSIKRLLTVVDVCLTGKAQMQMAFSLGFSDYEDAVQCASAMAEGLDAIVTRNTNDYANSPIQIYSPAEFIEVLQNESANQYPIRH